MSARPASLTRAVLGGLLAGAFLAGVPAHAGGPLLVQDGRAVVWSRHDVQGGPLNLKTVDVNHQGQRTIFYRVDSGPLGPLSNAQGLKFVDRIFGEYTDIPTADIKFRNAGPILDPDTGQPVDVDATNFGKFVDFDRPLFENPIVFDSDGGITGGGGVLGFFGFLQTDDEDNLAEGIVVLNGASVGPPNGVAPPSFLGVFTHEFGHFAGPLDHSQINGNIGLQAFLNSIGAPVDVGARIPDGFDDGQAADLFEPFTETLFPFLYDTAVTSTLGFADSGYFIATLDLDTINALSNLYPTKSYHEKSGAIDGQVFIKSGSDKIEVQAVDVVARRVDRGPYPPPPGTLAFTTPPAIDEDGVPAAPPARRSTDSLATVSAAVTGLDFGVGGYRISGLPEGRYQVQVQQILPFALGGSSIGPLNATDQLTLPVREEYYDGRQTSNDVNRFTPVSVSKGDVTKKIDLFINGLDESKPRKVKEVKPNFQVASAMVLDKLPARVSGKASATEAAEVVLDFGGGVTENVPSLYRLSLAEDRFLYLVLEPESGAGDLDLFFFETVPNPTSPDDLFVRSFSAGVTADEIVGLPFAAGDYMIGVGAFEGSVKYKLHVIPGKDPL